MMAKLVRLMNMGGGFVRSMGIYALAFAFYRLCSFGALPFLPTHLSKSDYGTIGLLMTSGWVMRAVANMGISSALPLLYFQHEGGQRCTMISTATGLTLPFLLLLIGTDWAFATPLSIAFTGAPGFDNALLLFVVSVALSAATGTWQTQLLLENRAGAYSLAFVVGGGITLIGTLILVVAFDMGVRGWVYASVVSGIVQSILVFFAVEHNQDKLFDKDAAKQLLQHGLPLLPLTFLVFGIQTTPIYAARWMGGIEAAGAFAYALNFALSLQIVSGAFSSAWPAFFMRFRHHPQEGSSVFHTVSTGLIGLQGLAAIGVAVGGALLVQLIAGPSMQQAALLVGWLAFAQVCASGIALPHPAFYFVGRLYWIALAFAAALVLQILALAVGYSAIGVTGVAAASAVGSAFVVVSLAAMASWRHWPGADPKWTHWCGRGLFLAALIAAGSGFEVFADLVPTLIWGGAAVAIWLLSFHNEVSRIKTALRA